MLLGYMTLFTALILSLSAAVYSILGLTAIFASAFWPIVILGGSLEIGKIVTVLWLHKYWTKAEIQYKLYLCSAVLILMVLTSMGVFGFLSKAHLDQAVPSGDIQAQVQIFDDKIQTQKDNIKTARAALTQMDSAVDQVMGRSQDEKGADKAVAIRRSQARERTALQNEISKAQTEITKLQEGRAPIASQARKVEAEVGPIKYIAALIYSDNPDQNILEKAVRWVIILIVIVFDPLALTLLLAATKAIEWEHGIDLFNLQKKKDEEPVEEESAESWFDRAKKRARFWDKHRVEQEKNEVEFEGVRINSRKWIQTGPEIPVPTHVKTVYDIDNLEPVFDRQEDIPAEEYSQADVILRQGVAGIDSSTAIPLNELAKDPSSPGWMFTNIPNTNDPVEVVDPLAHIIVPPIDKDQDPLHHLVKMMWLHGHPNPLDERAYHAQYQSGDIDRLPWHDAEHINNLPISDGEKKQLISRFVDIPQLPPTRFVEITPITVDTDSVSTPSVEEPSISENTPPGGDGNLWIPQNGQWINAGPMEQFDLSKLEITADNVPTGIAGEVKGFGTQFPIDVNKGDMFLRVDYLPSVLYKFNGTNWIEVDKALTDSHAYDQAYIDHLISKIDSGEYDPDLLSDAERDSIEKRLKQP